MQPPRKPSRTEGSRANVSRPDGEERRIGLARALSKLGFCSRSRATELIRAGRVRLNGSVRTNPETPVHAGRDRLVVDGGHVEAKARIYLLLNKPRGVITTTSDEKGRPTVYDSLRTSGVDVTKWLAPVGRLDKASEGLLLLTNDSEWATRILAPETHLEKTYHVQIGAIADETLLESLQNGLRDRGEFLRVKRAEVLRRGERNCWLKIVLDEGKNRQIRRMLEALHIPVFRLVRVAIGPLQLAELPKGASRPLTRAEKALLDSEMQRR